MRVPLAQRAPDVVEAVDIAHPQLALVAGRDAAGRVYLKAWDERDHHSIVLRQADRAGLDFFGFKVAGSADLDRFEAELRDDGLKTERIPAGDLLETGELP